MLALLDGIRTRTLLIVLAAVLLLAAIVGGLVWHDYSAEYRPQRMVNAIVHMAGPSDVSSDAQIDWLPYRPPVPDNAQPVMVRNYQVYLDAAKDVSIVLRPNSRGVQTFMYIEGPEAPSHYTFKFTMLPDSELRLTDDGMVNLIDTERNVTIPALKAPWAKSMNGTTYDTMFSLGGEHGSDVVQTIELANAHYPVIADPDFDDPLTQLIEGREPVLADARTGSRDGPSHNFPGGRYYMGPNGLEVRFTNFATKRIYDAVSGATGFALGEIAVGTAFVKALLGAIPGPLRAMFSSVAGGALGDGIMPDNSCLGITFEPLNQVVDPDAQRNNPYPVRTLEGDYVSGDFDNWPKHTLVWLEPCSGSGSVGDAVPPPVAVAPAPQPATPAQPAPQPPVVAPPVQQPPAPQPQPTVPQAPAYYTYYVYNTCANGHCGLTIRTGPGYSNYGSMGVLVDGNAVNIVCQTSGEAVSGVDGSSSTVWDRLTNGGYVGDFYVNTPGMNGAFSPPIPRC